MGKKSEVTQEQAQVQEQTAKFQSTLPEGKEAGRKARCKLCGHYPGCPYENKA